MEFRCIHRHTVYTHPACFIKNKVVEKDAWLPKKHWTDGMQIGLLDIETSDLQGDFGVILSWYIKPYHSNDYQYWVISYDEIDSKMYDYWGLIMFFEAVQDFDILITWYGARFDIPYLRTRAAMQRVDFPWYREKYHIDLWKASRSKFRFRSNRLDNVSKKLKIRDKKTEVDPEIWRSILRGDKDSLDYVAEHNRKDVDVLESVYKIFRPHLTYPRTSI